MLLEMHLRKYGVHSTTMQLGYKKRFIANLQKQIIGWQQKTIYRPQQKKSTPGNLNSKQQAAILLDFEPAYLLAHVHGVVLA